MNNGLFLHRMAQRFPDKPAVYHGAQCLLNWSQWSAHIANLADYFRSVGLQPGDRICIYMYNHPTFLHVIWAAWHAGLTIVPVNKKLHVKEVAWIIEDSGSKAICTDEQLSLTLDNILCIQRDDIASTAVTLTSPTEPHPVENDETAWIFYTSGTTGKPKGVELSHKNLRQMAWAYLSDVDDLCAEDTAVYAGPMSHGAGIYTLPYVMAGATQCIPEATAFSESELCSLARTLGRLTFFAAPTMVNRIVLHAQNQGLDGRGFKTIVYGGGPMFLEDLKNAINTLGPVFAQIYGQGECPMGITALRKSDIEHLITYEDWNRLGSVGTAQSSVLVRVVNESDEALPPGQIGEIVAKGEIVMKGYWNNSSATQTTLKNGWLHTGDLGEMDERGYITLKDRNKDVIISGGTNIYPREIEELLLTHPKVAATAVIGAIDPEWGEKVIAFIQPQKNEKLDTKELDQLCLENIARFKRPKEYIVIESLPVSPYGKILKTELRTLYLDAKRRPQ